MSDPITPILNQLRDDIVWTDDEPTDQDLADYLEHIIAIYKLASDWSHLRFLPTETEHDEGERLERKSDIERDIGVEFGDLHKPFPERTA